MCRKIRVDKRLDTWLEEQDVGLFPRAIDYKARYRGIAEYLTQNVHTEVEKGAILAEIEKGNVDANKVVYLNNHGPGHVDKVIKMASNLLSNSESDVSPYEGYILLAAIQFHDVGNIYGREEHEKKCKRIMNRLGQLVGEDRPEKNAITKIAAAHSGCNDGNRDTIAVLEKNHFLFEQIVRKQYLAAVLRFADELADDRTRASRFMLEEGKIPAWSVIYHTYSNCLHTVMVHGEEVILKFEINRSDAMKKFAKSNRRVYLLDEIYERTLKMHCERTYCMRFLKPDIDIKRIRVSIEVCSDIETDVMSDVIRKRGYCLEERGYPESPKIFELCPELKGKDGKWLRNELR